MRLAIGGFLLTVGLGVFGGGCRRAAPRVEAGPTPSGSPAKVGHERGSDVPIWPVVYGMVVLAEERGASNSGTPKLLWGGDDHDESFVAAVDGLTTPHVVRSIHGAIEITRRDGTHCSAPLGEPARLISWAYPPANGGWWERLEPEDPALASEVFSSGRRYWTKKAADCEGFGWATRPGVVSSYSPGVSVEPAPLDLRPAAEWEQWQQEFLAFQATLARSTQLPATWEALAGWQKTWRLESPGLSLTATCFGRFHEEESADGRVRFERNGLIVRDAAGKIVRSDWAPATSDESCGDLGVLRVGSAPPIVTLSTPRGYAAFAFDGTRLAGLPPLSVSGR